jgi:hypothetical protein
VTACARGTNPHAADRPGLGRLRRARAWLLASALVAPGAADGIAAQSRPPPTQSTNQASAPSSKAPQAEHHKGDSAAATKHKEAARPSDRKNASKPIPLPKERPAATDVPPLQPDLAATKQAIDLARHSRLGGATAMPALISDPVARNRDGCFGECGALPDCATTLPRSLPARRRWRAPPARDRAWRACPDRSAGPAFTPPVLRRHVEQRGPYRSAARHRAGSRGTRGRTNHRHLERRASPAVQAAVAAGEVDGRAPLGQNRFVMLASF